MAAIMGGTMRSPLTGAIFALELTGDMNALPALLLGSIIAHTFTVLIMKRSILTEKIARRGYHVSREYSVDPLERLMVEDVMTREVVTVQAALPVRDLLCNYFLDKGRGKHQGYPVIDRDGSLLGVVTRGDLLEHWMQETRARDQAGAGDNASIIITFDLLHRPPVTVFPWETCRTAAERMAEAGMGRLPVVSPSDPRMVIGIITRSDLLKPRARHLEEEVRREQLLLSDQVPARP
jgi:CBS domain-containing protein